MEPNPVYTSRDYRQTDRQTGGKRDRQVVRNRQVERQRQVVRQTGGERNRQTGGEIGK